MIEKTWVTSGTLAICMISGCATPPTTVKLAVELIENSLRCGTDLEQAQLEWIDDTAALTARYARFPRSKPAPAIDFATTRLLLVTMGRKTTTGYRLNYLHHHSAQDDGATIEISLVWQTPENPAQELPAETTPCLLLALPITGTRAVRVVDHQQRERLWLAATGS